MEAAAGRKFGFTCPHCGEFLVADCEMVNAKARCPECHRGIVVPQMTTGSIVIRRNDTCMIVKCPSCQARSWSLAPVRPGRKVACSECGKTFVCQSEMLKAPKEVLPPGRPGGAKRLLLLAGAAVGVLLLVCVLLFRPSDGGPEAVGSGESAEVPEAKAAPKPEKDPVETQDALIMAERRDDALSLPGFVGISFGAVREGEPWGVSAIDLNVRTGHFEGRAAGRRVLCEPLAENFPTQAISYVTCRSRSIFRIEVTLDPAAGTGNSPDEVFETCCRAVSSKYGVKSHVLHPKSRFRWSERCEKPAKECLFVLGEDDIHLINDAGVIRMIARSGACVRKAWTELGEQRRISAETGLDVLMQKGKSSGSAFEGWQPGTLSQFAGYSFGAVAEFPATVRSYASAGSVEWMIDLPVPFRSMRRCRVRATPRSRRIFSVVFDMRDGECGLEFTPDEEADNLRKLLSRLIKAPLKRRENAKWEAWDGQTGDTVVSLVHARGHMIVEVKNAFVEKLAQDEAVASRPGDAP